MSLKIALLISGRGSNLVAIQEAIERGELEAKIVLVFSNRPTAAGLEAAERLGLATAILDHTAFSTREAFDSELGAILEACQPDLVVLAGFMRIMTAKLVDRFRGRMINIHPSLLPLYPGLNTHQSALDAGDEFHGASVHFVTPDVDGGPVVAQAKIPIRSDDNAESLAAKLLVEEHRLYPRILQWIASGRLQYQGGEISFDGSKLNAPLQL